MSTTPFASIPIPNPRNTGTLEMMSAPLHRVLADFIHGCSPDVNTRTVAVTALVTSLWQLAGRGMTQRLPSLILLNATGSTPDPVDVLASRLVNDRGDAGPSIQRNGAYAYGQPEDAPLTMSNAILIRQQMGKLTALNFHNHKMNEARFYAAQATGFGTARSRPYSTAWHETFGLLTERNNELILRLEGPQDCLALRKHLLDDREMLRHPIGYGVGLSPLASTSPSQAP